MKYFLIILRIIFGALFIYSGIVKILNPIEFADDIRNFKLVDDPIVPALSLFIPWLELFSGGALATNFFSKGAICILLSLLVIFTVLIIISWFRGLDISCGCFGDNKLINYPKKVFENVLLIIVGLIIVLTIKFNSFKKV